MFRPYLCLAFPRYEGRSSLSPFFNGGRGRLKSKRLLFVFYAPSETIRQCDNSAAIRYSSECHYIGEARMDRAVSAADANRRFSELLRTVKSGQSVVVTSHGKPVARITPAAENEPVAEAARSALFARLKRERVVESGRWTCATRRWN
jgi:prevent-host-death family protein